MRTGKKSTRPLDKHRSIERSHRIDKDEFYALLRGVVIDSSKLFNEKIREWEHFYNYDRPHGGLNGQTPYERFKQKTSNEEPSVTENRQPYNGGPCSLRFHSFWDSMFQGFWDTSIRRFPWIWRHMRSPQF